MSDGPEPEFEPAPTSKPATRRERAHYEGDPTLIRVMLRPQWIAALVLALIVAGIFAWLGRWQLGTAIRTDEHTVPRSEVAVPLGELTEPGAPLMESAAAAVVSVRGSFVADDYLVVDGRLHGDTEGVWVTGHFAADGGGSLAVALGWAPNTQAAKQALAAIDADPTLTGVPLVLEGRYMPADNAETPKRDADPLAINRMAPAQLINRWHPFDGRAYAGYLVLHQENAGAPLGDAALAAHGLETIESVAALPAETVNWLNLFYALEWVVFAGFAVFFWYRLTRDAWEKDHELQALRAAGEPPAE